MKRFSKSLPVAANIVLPLLIYHYAAPHFGESIGDRSNLGHALGTGQQSVQGSRKERIRDSFDAL